MRLILIRHAEAAVLGEQGVTEDEQRPLTANGRAQCRPLVSALKRIACNLDRLLCSPLVRARQTAEEIVAVWGDGATQIEECASLAPGGKKRKLVTKLLQREVEVAALVGHNPDLSELIGWFIGDKQAGINLEKAGLACIEFEGVPDKGTGVLLWLVTPTWCSAASA